MPKRPIDLAAVRESRERLRRLAAEHPELIGPAGPENRAGWLAALEEDAMANTTQYTFRLPNELIERLDAYAARLAQEQAMPVTRADVVKQLLTRGLDGVETKKGPPPKKNGRR